MAHVFSLLNEQPFILLFLVVGMGFLLAKPKIMGINPGVVAWTLIFGLFLSTWAVRSEKVVFELPYLLQTLFFNLYIFCVGLRIGPQCFAGLERNGKQFAGVAVAELVMTGALTVLCGWYFHFDGGTLAGLVAGSNTASGSFGAAKSAASSGAAGSNGETLAVN